MQALVLSAGLGTRLRPHTNSVAKPAIPFLNIPLVYYPIYFLNSMGIKNFAFNTHHLPDTVKSVIENIPLKGINTQFFHESPSILGSGGGIKNAENFLSQSDPFAIMNGDEVMFMQDERLFQKALQFHRKKSPLATLLVIPHMGVGTRFGGVWLGQEDQVLGFGKQPPVRGTVGYHYVGFALYSKKIFDYIPSDGASNIFYDSLTNAIHQGESVYAFVDDQTAWFETGAEVDFIEATESCCDLLMRSTPESECLKRILLTMSKMKPQNSKESIWAADSSQVPNSVHLAEDSVLLVEEGAIIGEETLFEGFNIIGANTVIGSKSRLTNCIFGSSLNVPSNCHVAERVKLFATN